MVKKKSSQWTNTVTPFSKFLAMLLFILLPFIGFYLGTQYQQKIDIVWQQTNEDILSKTPQVTVQQFYNTYLTCLNNHFIHPSGTPSQDCPYESYASVSIELRNNVLGSVGDPILCAENTPKKILVDTERIQGGMATVIAHPYFTSGSYNILVQLQKIKDQWKITNITCPHS
ncbi:MAG TPA: hypothetical protein VLF89_08305 [Candidatus Saccharimonadales bacterium]|nr:hypothetical protein [Candidatus Saccharimonadales bacterium]